MQPVTKFGVDRSGSDGEQDRALVASALEPFRLRHWSIAGLWGLLLEAGFGDVTVIVGYRDDRVAGPETDVQTYKAAARHPAQ